MKIQKINKLTRNYKDFDQIKPFFNKALFTMIVFLISLILFFCLVQSLQSPVLKSFDLFVTNYIFLFRSSLLTDVMKFISRTGDTLGYIVMLTLMSFILVRKKKWILGLEGIVILILASGLNYVLKGVIARPRPFEFSLVQANYNSFPSGHAMSAMVFFGFLIHITNILVDKLWLKYLLIAVYLIMILAIGLSRIYLGVHYPSDIIGGYLSGLCWLMFCLTIINVLNINKLY